MTVLRKIQTGLWTSHPRTWAAHVKNESLDGAAQNHVQHLPKLRPSFSLCFAHSTLCGHFDCASYEDVLCMNVDQHDVNWLVVPFSTMNKTSNMMLTLFEKAVLIKMLCLWKLQFLIWNWNLQFLLWESHCLHFYTPMKLHFFKC